MEWDPQVWQAHISPFLSSSHSQEDDGEVEGGEVAWGLGGLLGVEQGGLDEPMEESRQLTPEGDEVPLEGEAELDDDVEETEEELDPL